MEGVTMLPWNGRNNLAKVIQSGIVHVMRSMGRRSGVAAKFVRKARENERRSREKNKLLPPQSPRGFCALARLYYYWLSAPTQNRHATQAIHVKGHNAFDVVKITYAVVKAIIFAPV